MWSTNNYKRNQKQNQDYAQMCIPTHACTQTGLCIYCNNTHLDHCYVSVQSVKENKIGINVMIIFQCILKQ